MIPLTLSKLLTGRPEALSMIAVAIAPGSPKRGPRRRRTHLPGTAAIGAPGELARVDTNSRIIHEAAVIVAILALALGAVSCSTPWRWPSSSAAREFGMLAALGWTRLRITGPAPRRKPCAQPARRRRRPLPRGRRRGTGRARARNRVFVSPEITAWVLVRGFLVGIALGVLGALFASWRVMRMPLLEALGAAPVASKRSSACARARTGPVRRASRG